MLFVWIGLFVWVCFVCLILFCQTEFCFFLLVWFYFALFGLICLVCFNLFLVCVTCLRLLCLFEFALLIWAHFVWLNFCLLDWDCFVWLSLLSLLEFVWVCLGLGRKMRTGGAVFPDQVPFFSWRVATWELFGKTWYVLPTMHDSTSLDNFLGVI